MKIYNFTTIIVKFFDKMYIFFFIFSWKQRFILVYV